MFGFQKQKSIAPAEPVTTCDTDLLYALNLLTVTPNDPDLLLHKYAVLEKANQAVRAAPVPHDETGQYVLDKLIDLCGHPTIAYIFKNVPRDHKSDKYSRDQTYFAFTFHNCQDAYIQPYMVQKAHHMIDENGDNSTQLMQDYMFCNLAKKHPDSMMSFMFDNACVRYPKYQNYYAERFYLTYNPLFKLRPDLLTESHVDSLHNSQDDYYNFYFLNTVFQIRPDLIKPDMVSHYSRAAMHMITANHMDKDNIFNEYRQNIVSFLTSDSGNHIPESNLQDIQLFVTEVGKTLPRHQDAVIYKKDASNNKAIQAFHANMASFMPSDSAQRYTPQPSIVVPTPAPPAPEVPNFSITSRDVADFKKELELAGVYGQQTQFITKQRTILANYVTKNSSADRFSF